MANSPKSSFKIWKPLLFSFILILGMIFGYDLHDTLRNKLDFQVAAQHNDRLEEIISLIRDKYVDTVNNDLLFKDAVNGVLKHLDPHTSYIPPEELQGINESLDGGFYGIGIEFAQIRDTVRVVAVIPGGPSYKAGLRVGELLISVELHIIAGKNLATDSIIHMLRGKQKSNVQVTVKMPLTDSVRNITIQRDEVPIYSVDVAMMIDSITGFIRINRFSANTYSEFHDALKLLKEKGLKQLVIDVRDNPGGYLDAVTGVADELLNDKKLIAYTKGLHTSRTEYTAGKTGLFEEGPLAILVDESSASASEILAGAVQDWDRGVIIGRRTFGKGLVQEQYDLSGGAALRLTIAKYFTPSGRCIQRSFAKGRYAYMLDYEKRLEEGDDSVKEIAANTDTTKYFTQKNRPVFGGGGINPDIVVPFDTSSVSRSVLALALSNNMRTAVWDYFISTRIHSNYLTVTHLNKQFKDEPYIIKSFLKLLSANEQQLAKTILANPSNAHFLALQIKAQLARLYFKDIGYFSILNPTDVVLQKAMQTLHSKQYLQLIKG